MKEDEEEEEEMKAKEMEDAGKSGMLGVKERGREGR